MVELAALGPGSPRFLGPRFPGEGQSRCRDRRAAAAFSRKGSSGLLGLAALHAGRVEAAPSFDLVLRGGTILDGTGGPPGGRLGIVGDTIAAVGTIAAEQGKRTLDVSRHCTSAPGFVDIHSHSDGDILAYPTNDSRVRQGVTTEMPGNCGAPPRPWPVSARRSARKGWHEESDVKADWSESRRTARGSKRWGCR